MHITVDCPECRSRYQLHADLQGRRMRCPNAKCQAVFVVQPVPAAAPSPAPVEPAPAVRASPRAPVPQSRERPAAGLPEAPAEILDWRLAPPPVRDPASDLPGPKEPASRSPRPILGDPGPAPAPAPPPPAATPTRLEKPAPRRGRRLVLAALVLFILGTAAFGIVTIVQRTARAEERLRGDAEQSYAAGNFTRAAQQYSQLADAFPRSEAAPAYRFRAELAGLRELAARTPPEPAELIRQSEDFFDRHARDPRQRDILKEARPELSQAFLASSRAWLAALEADLQAPDAVPDLPARIQFGEQILGLVERYPSAQADLPEMRKRLARLGQDLLAARERQETIRGVLAMLKAPQPDLSAARSAIRRGHVQNEAKVQAALREAESRQLKQINYQTLDRPAGTTGPDAGPPGLILASKPLEYPQPAAAAEVVYAVARGVLSALDARNGRHLWSARVGLDSQELPVRVPANPQGPELVLVTGSGPPALTARDALTGQVVWHQPLEEPALGRPLLVGPRLFVPTAGPRGLIHELDARSGLLRGQFSVHQPLGAGAAYDRAMQRLYVPARELVVFVFHCDGSSVPHCEGAITTGHPPGALRGAPIVVSGEEGIEVPRYLVLGETEGLNAMRLRSFRLLPAPTEVAFPAEVRLAGWSSFPPYADPETLALVTDAGAIGLFGIHQAGMADPPLFPLLGTPIAAAAATPQRGRTELVHADEVGFWVLAGGKLQQFRFGLDRRLGRQVKPVARAPLAIGSPLHASQVSPARDRLVLVTQTDDPPAHLATAVETATGRVLWQRTLGLTIQGEPLVQGDKLLVLEQSGALTRFDPARLPAQASTPWIEAGEPLADPVTDLVGRPRLLPMPDGQTALELLTRPEGTEFRLVLRRVPREGPWLESSVRIPAPLAGTPALQGSRLVAPLANGQLIQVDLEGPRPRRELGPDWRGLGSKADARAAVVPWKPEEFLVYDGQRKLMRLRWPWGNSFELNRQQAIELEHRLAGEPLILPPGQGVLFADQAGHVMVLRGDPPALARTWKLGGPERQVTAGPWRVGAHVALVLNRRELVWLDPEQDRPLWTAALPGDGLEFPPLALDGQLVVVDLSGRYRVLDAASGQVVGPERQHPAEVAPVSGVLPFGPGRLFAPLSDGTIWLLPAPASSQSSRR